MLLSIFTALVGTAVAFDPYVNSTVFNPGASLVTYARTESLPNNIVLAAWSDPDQLNGTIQIYRSSNNGREWYRFGSARSEEGRKLLQPHLLFLNETQWLGGTGLQATLNSNDESEEEDNLRGPKIAKRQTRPNSGTVILAVNAVDATSTNIELYASADGGQTFRFIQSVASGGQLNNANSGSVAEPFLIRHGEEALTVFFSDGRDREHDQKVSSITTMYDLESFGDSIDAASFRTRTHKPGLASVTKLPNNDYIMVFEYAQLSGNSTTAYDYPIYYKISTSPQNFAAEPAQKLVIDNGVRPWGGPFVTWSPVGGANGTIIISDSSANAIFVNQALGQGTWRSVNTTASRAYSREIRIPTNDNTKIRFAGGSEYGQRYSSPILVTVMDLQQALREL